MKKLIYLIVLIAIVGGGYWYYQNYLANDEIAQQQENSLGAEIVWVEGGVEYKQGESDWTRASVDVELAEGDSVETLADGRAIINFDDGSAIRLDNKTRIVISSLQPEHVSIQNEAGQVYARVTKSVRIFDIQAGETIYESLGTAYKTINKEEQKGVEVYESKVKVIDRDKNETIVEEGNKYLLENKADDKIENKLVKISEADIAKDVFVIWNQEQDKKIIEEEVTDPEIEEPAPTTTVVVVDDDGETPAVPEANLTLIAVKTDSGIKFTWTVNGINVDQGFKLVRSIEANPVYPGNDYQYLTNKDQRSYTWGIKDGKTYYFRVCQYLGGKCGVYSNNVKIAAPLVEKPVENPSGEVTSITLSSPAAGKVVWKTAGTSDQGFKVVWSKTSGPTYPCREGDKYNYLTSPTANASVLEAFDGAGDYYVRVCEYLGGKCGVYSNQIKVALGSAAAENPVKSIALSGSGSSVSWTIDGYSKSGFKVVWSKASGPTYPCREGDKYNYLSDPAARASSLDSFDEAGTYYVRVCEYLGGKCGVYSNQITVSLD